MRYLGKVSFLCESFRNGKSVISIMSQPLTVFQRKDGTFFFLSRGKRINLTQKDDGSFYYRTDTGELA